jgi:hypothetical protein
MSSQITHFAAVHALLFHSEDQAAALAAITADVAFAAPALFSTVGSRQTSAVLLDFG